LVEPTYSRNIWFTERNEYIALSLRHKGDPLYKKQSKFQKVEIYDTYQFGRMLTCDGAIMCAEKDEHAYHEMICHVPVFAHANPKRVLVIGGGDGGTVREIVRHEQIAQITLVEIDPLVVEASRKHLPTLSSALDHPKLTLKIDDGIKYVANAADGAFDIILIDSTDPVGPAVGLFNAEFYHQVHRVLAPNGIMVAQSESPRFNIPVFKEIFNAHRKVFGSNNVYPYLAFIPTYPTGMWSFSFCAKGTTHPLNRFREDAAAKFSIDQNLNYYNEQIHRSAFVLPRFVQKMIQE
jgi:spermidine synthase